MEYSDSGPAIRKGRFLREQVYKNLKAFILNGDLEPNKRLIEEKLAEEMGTSRTPIREAIQKLEKEGLIRKLPRGGFAVSLITDEDIDEVFGIRGVLEGYAGYLATLKAKEEDISALEEIVHREEECMKAQDMEEIVRLNTEFHDRLYRTAKSERLYNIINDLRDFIYRFRKIIFRFSGMAEISIQDHKEMIKLMKLKKASQVENLIRKHITRGKNLIKRKLKKDTSIYGAYKKNT
ncbi:MAG TPA: GntR family transcriptional regulator [Syntrophorhabdaceae bacterium]|nr:GntR family transcriptional regulator [Syntrophorhabdaceae bacterium]HOL05977.1 GntR family transcriptional regulator [Syntrophorhabdaceae bacterium]HON84970.1 GntR family transcriptional regulator [Syntrophorhabdaceae bacterium]HOT41691.1 GntR family transcriptional regulator [Syntrophorhabdaceae bacterium]HPC66617.1 GntR family transcriptional regulator [Syntrophorhabdaceae bacterium]